MKLKGYIFSRSFLSERVPQFVQNLVIRDYCNRNQYNFALSATEYAMDGSYLILNQVINDDLKNCDGIILYSLFQLPKIIENRREIINKILDNDKEIHFALENLKIINFHDSDYINDIWGIANNMISNEDVLNIRKNQLPL